MLVMIKYGGDRMVEKRSPEYNDFMEELEMLKKENQLLKEILDHIHEAVCSTDENDVLVVYNREAEKIEDLKKEDVLGKKEVEVFTSPDYLFDVEITNKVKRTGKSLIEHPFEYTLTNGNKVKVILNSYPFFYQNKLCGVYNIFRNINQISEFIAVTLEMQKKFSRKEDDPSGAKYILDDIIGEDQKIKETIALARKVALHDMPVFIVGETGTGKELFANGIHNASLFSKGPFVPVNCAAIPASLMESVLFGTEKGAFTGAVEMPGLFEQANGGTIFLDEINSLPMELQPKLLRVIQDKAVRRIGSKKEIPITCRILSATNANPSAADFAKILRPDLYYRLATVTVSIPPLRQRKGDLKILSAYFVKKYCKEFDLFISDISDEVLEIFNIYSWPGNVRELDSVIGRCMFAAGKEDRILSKDLLPQYLTEKVSANQCPQDIYDDQGSLRSALWEFEKNKIISALRKNHGNITKSAQELGVLRQNLHYRIRRFGIDVNELGHYDNE
jgi:arginine utilization regulatory protein